MPSIRGVVNEFYIYSSCSLHNPTIHESHAGRPTTWIRNKEREGESESESERREWRRGDAHFGPYPPVRNWWPCIRPCLFHAYISTLLRSSKFASFSSKSNNCEWSKKKNQMTKINYLICIFVHSWEFHSLSLSVSFHVHCLDFL